MSGAGWSLALAVPAGALAIFEAALERLGGALVTGGPDGAGLVPVAVYLADPPERAQVTALLAAAAAAARTAVPEVTVEPLPEVDWVAESQKALPPIRAGRFYVHGSHVREPAPAGTIAIRIDANVAFGTGRHETTRGCLIALGDLAKRRAVRRPLDMGCGSGILALAMARLWARPVLAADNDADSVRVTGENARINGAGRLVRPVLSDGYAGAAVARRAPFDLVVANILAEPLCAMAADLGRVLAPGGVAVLSGLLAGEQARGLAAHRAQGLRLARRVLLDGWATLVLAR